MQGLLIYIFHSHTHTHPCVLCVYNVYVSILWRGSREYIVALAHHKYLLDYSRGPFFFSVLSVRPPTRWRFSLRQQTFQSCSSLSFSPPLRSMARSFRPVPWDTRMYGRAVDIISLGVFSFLESSFFFPELKILLDRKKKRGILIVFFFFFQW